MAHDAHQGVGSAGADRGRLRSALATPDLEERRAELAATLQRVTRITLRPIAGPLPLGFVALAAATSVLGALQLGWLPASEGRNVGLILLAFVFPLQLTASVFGILARDGVAGTAMGILAGTWLSVGLVTLTSPPGGTSEALGVLLIVAALGMVVPVIGASISKIAPTVVLSGTVLRFASAGAYQLSGSATWESITGWIGIGLAIVALYAALAIGVEEARGRTVLPIGRRRRGREAVEGGFTEQVLDLVNEPGVRRQL